MAILGFGLFGGFRLGAAVVAEAVAAAGDGDDVGVVQEAVEDLSNLPVVDWPLSFGLSLQFGQWMANSSPSLILSIADNRKLQRK